MNHGFGKVERLRGNIGYLEFFNFMDEEPGAETVAAPMNFVNNTDALINDMRSNGGGNPAMGKAFAQFTRCARPFNYLGLPTLSLPCGFGTSGLPLGFQLVARPLMEETLFAVGSAYQAATTFHTQVPAG